MTNEDDVVLYDVADKVATLTLNRPDRLNAWNDEMEARFFELLDFADDDPAVNVIVITGAGRGFCAGMDAAVLTDRVEEGRDAVWRFRPVTHALSMRKLTIAAVNGGCAGLGFVQALCCDVRFAATTAKFATAFTRRGLPPEYASTWLLSRIVGAGHATDLMLSGRAVTGIEAAGMGLVNRAVELDELLPFTYEYARDVAANCSPRAIAYAKADLRADWDRTFEQALTHSASVYQRPNHAEDFAEGVTSFVERRPPRFEPVPRRA
jgi:enoyl-CoA hydratase/carnithine racemase